MRAAHLFVLLTLSVAVLGAGLFDILTPMLPLFRPYSAPFIVSPRPAPIVHNSLMGDILGATIIIIFAMSLLATIANRTTGITIAHTGFTPNPNVTASTGLVPITQLVPFVFAALLLFGLVKLFDRHKPGGL